MAFIRPYKPSDFEAMAHICRDTMPPSLQASEPARRVGPYLWTHPFTHLSPQTCFVLDSGSGSDPVGYCIVGGSGTKAPWLLDDGQINETALAQMAYQAEWLLLNGQEDLMEEGYKATMHIDLLDEWQGKGWGRKLIEAFVESVKVARQQQDGSVSRGIWIGVAADNSKVVPFYQKQGFKIKERRKQSKSTTMVREY
ncbi:hypothetical protein ACCO45_009068 [Purpureocillium lilacinum]|uniref:Uncharacterized protein n=1 Tax=Purpureocillium lilacinum TaxID=33203 RepID=A0ACC4DK89_PURLI